MKGEKKATTTKRTQKNTCNWISQPYSNKKKATEDLKINKIKKNITHNALI